MFLKITLDALCGARRRDIRSQRVACEASKQGRFVVGFSCLKPTAKRPRLIRYRESTRGIRKVQYAPSRISTN